jgi:WD40 repeat protein
MLNLQNIETIDTFENLKGVIAVTYDPAINLIAFPNKSSGFVKIKNLDRNTSILTNAHNSKIAFLALSQDGVLLGTASEKGRNVRIFKTDDGTYLEEYPIDSQSSQIFSINFDKNVKFF